MAALHVAARCCSNRVHMGLSQRGPLAAVLAAELAGDRDLPVLRLARAAWASALPRGARCVSLFAGP